MNVVCFGDSNTYGYEPRSFFGDRYEADCRWVDILSVKTGWNVINEGENGREIPVRSIQVPEDTDLLIIMLGTNDLLQGNSVDAVTNRMERFLCGLNMKKENILLVAPPVMQLGLWVPSRSFIEASEQLAHQYRLLAVQLGVRFANSADWNIPMAFDGVHFTEDGHKAFAEGLYNYLNKGE